MSHRRYSAVLFDLDGTLVDSADDILAAFAHTLRAAGLDPDPDPEAARSHLGYPLDVMLRRMGYAFPPEAYEGIVAVYAAYYMKHWADRTRLYDGVEALLESLAPVPCALVTQKRQNQAEGMVRTFGLEARFQCVLGLGPGLRAKPAPDLLFLAAERLGVRPADAVMVGDSPLDLGAARAAGMGNAAVTWGFTDAAVLEAQGPDFLARTPEVLGNWLRRVLKR
jgi:phosphoglycolate phosphatase